MGDVGLSTDALLAVADSSSNDDRAAAPMLVMQVDRNCRRVLESSVEGFMVVL